MKAVSKSKVRVDKANGRKVGLVVFAVVLVVAITFVLIYGTQFAGKAIAIAPEVLKAGEAGIPLKAGSTMNVNSEEQFTVYANLGNKDAYGFSFELSYNPQLLDYTGHIDALKGVTIINEKLTKGKLVNKLSITGVITELKADGTPTKTLKDVARGSLFPLIKLKFRAVGAGDASLKFGNFEMPDVADPRTNIIIQKGLETVVFKIVGKASAKPIGKEICDNGIDDDGDKKADCNDEDCVLTPACPPEGECSETDGGNNPQQKGTLTTVDGQIFTDSCSLDGKSPVSKNLKDEGLYVYEYFCTADKKGLQAIPNFKCPEGTTCKDAVCVSLQAVDCTISGPNDKSCVIKFKDANLEKAVKANIGLSDNQKVTLQLAITTKILKLNTKNIADLSGLEFFTGLEELHLNSNKFKYLTPISKLNSLTKLYLVGNQLKNIYLLKYLVNLKWLYLSKNQLTDISYLKDLVNLEVLILAENQLTDISPLKDLANLHYLDTDEQKDNKLKCQGSVGSIVNAKAGKAAVKDFIEECTK